jgi:DNA-binding NtrC family response regulator
MRFSDKLCQCSRAAAAFETRREVIPPAFFLHKREFDSLEATVSVQFPVVISAARPGAIRILHIEDDPSVARSLARLLRLRGFEIASAATPDDVVRQLEVDGYRPDLILTDFQLGHGSTVEAIVADIASRLQYKPPVIMMTGISGQPVEDARSFADRILAKPVDIHVLLCEIDELLDADPSTDRQS